MNTQEQEKRPISLTIFSPVNVSVFYNSKDTILMTIDLNSGFNYENMQFMTEDNFRLIFVGKGFEKSVKFVAKPSEVSSNYEFHLPRILTQEEINNSYDREDAINHIYSAPNGFAYEQLQYVGEEDDIVLLHNELVRLTSVAESDLQNDYLIARCALALGTNALKFDKPEEIELIRSVYENYNSKETYGYMFDKFIVG